MWMFRGCIVLSLLGSVILTTAASPAAWSTEPLDLTVVVSNLRNANGQVRVALWAGPEGFTDADAAVMETGQPAAEGKVRFVFSGLAPGRYAVATFHDENGNGEFDRTWIGLPDEGLGFSNGAWIDLGPPAFEDAAVDLNGQPREIMVPLRY
jgi:uncharacterized protein (DUF2141 family)